MRALYGFASAATHGGRGMQMAKTQSRPRPLPAHFRVPHPPQQARRQEQQPSATAEAQRRDGCAPGGMATRKRQKVALWELGNVPRPPPCPRGGEASSAANAAKRQLAPFVRDAETCTISTSDASPRSTSRARNSVWQHNRSRCQRCELASYCSGSRG